jgi:hypothetical protein
MEFRIFELSNHMQQVIVIEKDEELDGKLSSLMV